MIDTDVPARCPCCGTHELAVVSIANDPRGITRVTFTCDTCTPTTHNERTAS